MRSASMRHLFAGSRLSEALAAAAWSATNRLATWPPDDLLNTAEADVTEQLVELATIEAPSLARGDARLEPSREVTVKPRTSIGSSTSPLPASRSSSRSPEPLRRSK
jgi:hypothetical protein